MNLHLPPGARGGLVMGKASIELIKHLDGQDVGGAAVALPPQQSNPNEVKFPIVSVGGVSKTLYLAAQLMPYFLTLTTENERSSWQEDFDWAANKSVWAAKALLKAADEPVQSKLD